MAEQKTYVPKSGAKKIDFNGGGSLLKLNFHAETLIEFIKANANERGYITLGVTARRQPSERGDTHCIWLDNWKPDPARRSADDAQRPVARPAGGQTEKPVPVAGDGVVESDDDVPF
jgi:hypothetical protein